MGAAGARLAGRWVMANLPRPTWRLLPQRRRARGRGGARRGAARGRGGGGGACAAAAARPSLRRAPALPGLLRGGRRGQGAWWESPGYAGTRGSLPRSPGTPRLARGSACWGEVSLSQGPEEDGVCAGHTDAPVGTEAVLIYQRWLQTCVLISLHTYYEVIGQVWRKIQFPPY